MEKTEDLTKLAQVRTEEAIQRSMLANERTFSAWLRTGLAAVIAGLGISRFLGAGNYSWIAPAIGASLILVGGGIYMLAFWSYRQAYHKMRIMDFARIPLWLLSIIVVVLLLSALLSFLLLV